MSEIVLVVENVQLNYIEFSLLTGIINLSKENISLIVNDKNYSNYSIEDISNNGEKYKIIPMGKFTKYDSVSIQINYNNMFSNRVKIFICKFFENETDMDIRIIESMPGEYKLTLSNVNDIPFGVQSENFTVSLPLNMDFCVARLNGSSQYNIGEEIVFNIELRDVDGELVPDGNYLMEVEWIKLQ